ncbi:MAG: hypothetical protein LBB72_06915 [Spirochaetaceae bacterium]|nr:hypothetical protein [Spirochaetaceae bacterium]
METAASCRLKQWIVSEVRNLCVEATRYDYKHKPHSLPAAGRPITH